MTLARSKTLTFEEYANLDDPDHRYELVRGDLVLMTPPSGQHSAITECVHDALKAAIKQNRCSWVARRDIGVRVDIDLARTPDVCVMTLQQEQRILTISAILQSPPVLVVEVISPTTASIDYRAKRSEYATRGIPEYWIVDPFEAKVSILSLQDGFYEVSEFRENAKILSPTFPDLELTSIEIFAAGR